MTPVRKKYRPCASVLILRPTKDGSGHEVLVVHKHRKKDAWQLPQGGIEQGESPQQAASRELQEEINLHCSPYAFRKSALFYQYNYPAAFIKREQPKWDGQRLTLLVLHVPHSTVVQVDDDELDKSKWIKPTQLPTYLKRRPYLSVVKKLLQEAVGSSKRSRAKQQST